MKKTVILGDIHGLKIWRHIVDNETPDRVVFIGDYFDSFTISAWEQVQNFMDIIEFKKAGNCEVILLLGNHDYQYLPGITETYSGYQPAVSSTIERMLSENKAEINMAYKMGEYLFTHAGVSSVFMDDVFGNGGWNVDRMVEQLNDMLQYKPLTFSFDNAATSIRYKRGWPNSTGENEEQSPLWIRPRSLMKANRNTLRNQVIQVVGHTAQAKIDKKGKTTGGRYYFIDTLETSGEYLVIENDRININKI